MSKIDELIKEKCPNGVEYKTLEQLEGSRVITLGRGKVISKKDIQDNPGEYPIYSSSAVGSGLLGTYGDYMFEDVRLSWSIDGGGKFFYRDAPKYSVTNVCGWLTVNKPEIMDIKYLYFALTNEWNKKVFDYVHKAHPSVIRKEYTIPVPPLEIQQEIVRMLNSFTELEAELEAELTKRKQQYEYYRDHLLSFENIAGEGGQVKWLPLRELADFRNGKGHEKNIVPDGQFIVVNSKYISTDGKVAKYTDSQICPLFKDDICLVMSDLPNGKALAKCRLIDEDDRYSLNQRIGAFTNKDNEKVINKYLFYILNRNPQLLRYDNGTDQTNLKKDEILDISIPVPSKKIQERIVYVLDNFDAVCNDLNIGLPAEIEARQKQYEYYRDRLLSFDAVIGAGTERERERERSS